MRFARLFAPRRPSFAREEQAGHMVRAAAEMLAVDAVDVRQKLRFDEASRRLGHALHSRLADARPILDASPMVRDADGVPRPMVALVCGHEDNPEEGVRSAMRLFLTSDWSPAN